MKQRFSSLDVKVIALELANSLVSLRLANIYDLSSRVFLLKFAKPDNRQQILIDSGFRCHLTSFSRTIATAPSPFVARLRKYLRTRRVTSVAQVGTDRILEFQFSDGQYRLFLEFYAGGNVVLTDKDLVIICLFRIVPAGPEQEELRVGLKYLLENRQNYYGVPQLARERLRDIIQKAADRPEEGAAAHKRKSKTKQAGSLRKALSASLSEFPPTVIDHAMRLQGGFSDDLTPQRVLEDESMLDSLLDMLRTAQHVIRDITQSHNSKGYIIAKTLKGSSWESKTDADLPARNDLIYEDFHPFQPKQFEGKQDTHILEFDGFNKTVDEFFSSIESQKLESRLNEREENAKKKVNTARQEHEKRLEGLQHAQQLNVRKAEAIEANLQKVQEAIAAVNGLIAQGMDWVEIARLVEMEQAKHNPVAEMIKLPLKLYENTATLLLSVAIFSEEDYDGSVTNSDISSSEDDELTSPTARQPRKTVGDILAVDVDLALSPWANARQYYDQKRTAALKEQKTIQSSTKALKSTERKVNADLTKALKQEKQLMRPVRKQQWFEKFIYFISSDGYLVLGGRDGTQNEILYKRYLKKGDVYVHADLQGAAPVVIKNKADMSEQPIPPSTLSQAGSLVVSTSSAWDSKAVMSAWWVKADSTYISESLFLFVPSCFSSARVLGAHSLTGLLGQVAAQETSLAKLGTDSEISTEVCKTTPTGEYLTTGNFDIREEKNFLPPSQLLLGFGVLFQISEESKARHMKNRFVGNQEERAPLSTTAQKASNSLNVTAVHQLEEIVDTHDKGEKGPSRANSREDLKGQGETKLEESDVGDEVGDSTDEDIDDNNADEISYRKDQNFENEEECMGNVKLESLKDRKSLMRARINPLQPQSGEYDESSQDSEEAFVVEQSRGYGDQPAEVGEDIFDDSFHSQEGYSSSCSNGSLQAIVPHLSATEGHFRGQDQYRASSDTIDLTEPVLPREVTDNDGLFVSTGKIHSVAPSTKPQSNAKRLHVRGKHGKRDKIRGKYANQDEEDRVLALQLLGAAAGHQKVVEDGEAKAAKARELIAQKERRRKQHALADEKGKKADEIRQVTMQEGIETVDDEDVEDQGDLDAFVGALLPGDEILDALVVCGPWDAIGSRCRWKAKLQPGTTKKGKAVREILNAWTSTIEDKNKKPRTLTADAPDTVEQMTTAREAELVKGIREQEVIGIVPVSKCRVILSGGEDKGRVGRGSGKGNRGGKGSKRQR